jgi:hypothetical protein
LIHEPGEPWWNDIDRGKLLIHPLELSGNPTISHLVENQEKLGEGNYEFGLQSNFVHTSSDFLYAVKSYNMGPTGLLPL